MFHEIVKGNPPNKVKIFPLHSLKLTANAPENRPSQKETSSYSNHAFPGAFDVSFREGTIPNFFPR